MAGEIYEMHWWELLAVWATVGTVLGILGALAFSGSPRVGWLVGVPSAMLLGGALELLHRWKESR